MMLNRNPVLYVYVFVYHLHNGLMLNRNPVLYMYVFVYHLHHGLMPG